MRLFLLSKPNDWSHPEAHHPTSIFAVHEAMFHAFSLTYDSRTVYLSKCIIFLLMYGL
jgi:hypothetical protein